MLESLRNIVESVKDFFQKRLDDVGKDSGCLMLRDVWRDQRILNGADQERNQLRQQ